MLKAGYLRAVDAVNRVAAYAIALLLASMTVIIIVHVFWRYALNDSLNWTEEASRYLMLWMTFLGAGLLIRTGGLVAARAFVEWLPRPVRRVVDVVGYLIVLAICVLLVGVGFQLALSMEGRHSSALGLSMTIPYLSLPVGALLMVANQLALLVGGADSAPDILRQPTVEDVEES